MTAVRGRGQPRLKTVAQRVFPRLGVQFIVLQRVQNLRAHPHFGLVHNVHNELVRVVQVVFGNILQPRAVERWNVLLEEFVVGVPYIFVRSSRASREGSQRVVGLAQLLKTLGGTGGAIAVWVSVQRRSKIGFAQFFLREGGRGETQSLTQAGVHHHQ